MDKEKQTQFLQIAGVIGLAVFLLLPVLWYANRAKSPERAMTAEQLKSFQNDNLEFVDHNGPTLSDFDEGNVGREGQRSKWENTGNAIVSVNINNIITLSKEELQQVGATPFSLMNTVMNNIKTTPQVIEVVFDNEDVLIGFTNRQSVKELASNPKKLYDMVSSQDIAIERFVKSPSVQGVLNSERLLRSILKSKLFNYIFQTATAKYYIANPLKTKKLIASNPVLAPYLKHQGLKKVLSEIPATRQAASQIFK